MSTLKQQTAWIREQVKATLAIPRSSRDPRFYLRKYGVCSIEWYKNLIRSFELGRTYRKTSPQLKQPWQPTAGDSGTRRGPLSKSMAKKPGPSKKITAALRSVLQQDISRHPTSLQSARAERLNRASRSKNRSPVTQCDISRELKRGVKRRRIDENRDTLAGQGAVSITRKAIKKRPFQWSEEERTAVVKRARAYSRHLLLATDEKHINNLVCNPRMGYGTVGKAVEIPTDEVKMWGASTTNFVGPASERWPEGFKYCAVNKDYNKCTNKKRGEPCEAKCGARTGPTRRCGGGATEAVFLFDLEHALQKYWGVNDKPAHAIKIDHRKKRQHAILLDKAATHVWNKIINPDTHFMGKAKESVVRLCKHYGFKVEVLARRSYDTRSVGCAHIE